MKTPNLFMLINIIKANIDRIEGYKNAKMHVKEKKYLTYLFDQCIKQSESYVLKLNNLITLNGIAIVENKSALGYFNNLWWTIKYFLSTNKNEAVVLTCSKFDEQAIRHYDSILETEFAESYFPLIKKVLNVQRERIGLMHEKLQLHLRSESSLSINESILIPVSKTIHRF